MYNTIGVVMKNINFLQDNDSIGITAVSCGVLKKINSYEEGLKKFSNYRIIETSNVRTGGIVSSDVNTRVKELNDLYINEDIKCIILAAGGDFAFEMLDSINYDSIRNNLKWICGSSDCTSILYTISTKLDIPTIYSPCNVSGLRSNHISIDNYLNILKGNLVKQYKSDKYESEKNDSIDYVLDKDNIWESNKDIDISGILIGGCLDCLKDIIGTKYDGTKDFINKYKDEGIIWYFDIFGLSCECLYNTLLQFKYAGYFDNCNLIVLGKVCFPNSYLDLDYSDMIKKALEGYNYIINFDIGHIKPSFTMINGYKVRIINNKKETSMEYII